MDSVWVKRGKVRQLWQVVCMWGSAKKSAMTTLMFGAGEGFVNHLLDFFWVLLAGSP
jgi:hypothetical protein